jgi:hypothetical protein
MSTGRRAQQLGSVRMPIVRRWGAMKVREITRHVRDLLDDIGAR